MRLRRKKNPESTKEKTGNQTDASGLGEAAPEEALPPPRFPCVAICGVGLLGGSLGLAMREKHMAGQVIGVGRHAGRLKKAQAMGAIDEWSLELRQICPLADLIVLCGPVNVILDQLPDVMESAKPGAMITDVGSTKRSIVKLATTLTRDDAFFVGSHPMAGSEKSGAAHASADLFQGAAVILTPDLATTDRALETVRYLWETVGMRVVEMLPARHDRLLVTISHLPHLAAAALVEYLDRSPDANLDHLKTIAGPGFYDTTRIAKGSPEMWADIFTDNDDALLESIDLLQEILTEVRRNIASGNRRLLVDFLDRVRQLRKDFDR